MKIYLLGSPQAGQQQLFNLLCNIQLNTILQKPLETHSGVCQVHDPRIDKLAEIYKPQKTTYARIEYLLLPDFSIQNPQLKNADEICWVSRSQTAAENIRSFISELMITDLMVIEKRMETLAKDQHKKFLETREKEKQLLETCRRQLEQEKLLRKLTFTAEQVKALRTYQFLTLKPLTLVLNVEENQLKDLTLAEKISAQFNCPCLQLCTDLESEINQLPPEERAVFLKEIGIIEPAVDKMARLAFHGLGLISFFTVGADEVRAWPVRAGALLPEAGGVIHSDIEKGFIRAEMFKYADLITAGSENRLKETGRYYLKGKDYTVVDGDCLSFRFNI